MRKALFFVIALTLLGCNKLSRRPSKIIKYKKLRLRTTMRDCPLSWLTASRLLP